MAPKKKLTDVQQLDEKRQQLEFLKRQCYAVEQLMMLASENTRCKIHEKAVLKKRLAELQDQCETMEQRIDDNVRAMRQMSTACEEQLQQRLKNLQQKAAEAENNNAELRTKIEEIKRGKGEEVQRLKDSVASLKKQLETSALGYGVKLKDILVVQK